MSKKESNGVARSKTGITRRTAAAMIAATPLALAGRVPAAAASKDPSVFRVGALLGLSGHTDGYNGMIMQRGIEQAVNEINAAGGIDGIKLEAVIEDHQGVPKGGVDSLERLRLQYNIHMVLSSFSSIMLAIAPIIEQHKIVTIDGGSVADTKKYKYLFRDRTLASDLARAALLPAEKQKLTKMAELVRSSADGVSLRKAAEPAWKTYGGTIVADETMEPDATNIDTQMAKLKASNADVLAIWAFDPDPGLALKRARQFGMKELIIGIEFTPQIARIAGAAANGFTYASDYFDPHGDSKFTKEFVTGYEKKYNEAPGIYPANYYEMIYIFADCLRRAKAKGGDYYNGPSIRAALESNPTFPSVYGGDLTFRPDGTVSKRIAIFKVKDSKGDFQEFVTLKAS